MQANLNDRISFKVRDPAYARALVALKNQEDAKTSVIQPSVKILPKDIVKDDGACQCSVWEFAHYFGSELRVGSTFLDTTDVIISPR